MGELAERVGQVFEARDREIEQLKKERDHWKANHDNQVRHKAELRERLKLAGWNGALELAHKTIQHQVGLIAELKQERLAGWGGWSDPAFVTPQERLQHLTQLTSEAWKEAVQAHVLPVDRYAGHIYELGVDVPAGADVAVAMSNAVEFSDATAASSVHDWLPKDRRWPGFVPQTRLATPAETEEFSEQLGNDMAARYGYSGARSGRSTSTVPNVVEVPREPIMTRQSFDFDVPLDFDEDDARDHGDAIFAAGCDDATLSCRSGDWFLVFTREARTLEDARRTACGQIVSTMRQRGYTDRVFRADYEELSCNNDQWLRSMGMTQNRFGNWRLPDEDWYVTPLEHGKYLVMRDGFVAEGGQPPFEFSDPEVLLGMLPELQGERFTAALHAG